MSLKDILLFNKILAKFICTKNILFIERLKCAKTFGSRDLVYEGIFRLSSHTPFGYSLMSFSRTMTKTSSTA